MHLTPLPQHHAVRGSQGPLAGRADAARAHRQLLMVQTRPPSLLKQFGWPLKTLWRPSYGAAGRQVIYYYYEYRLPLILHLTWTVISLTRHTTIALLHCRPSPAPALLLRGGSRFLGGPIARATVGEYLWPYWCAAAPPSTPRTRPRVRSCPGARGGAERRAGSRRRQRNGACTPPRVFPLPSTARLQLRGTPAHGSPIVHRGALRRNGGRDFPFPLSRNHVSNLALFSSPRSSCFPARPSASRSS